MNAWQTSGIALIVGILLCLVASMRHGRFQRLIAVQLGTTLSVFALFALGEGFDRTFLQDLALTAAVLSLPGTLAYVRWIGRLP
ncbi:MAG: monovalent cation/H+ antiporter complex subunit F [Myxococcaceae bacterium]